MRKAKHDEKYKPNPVFFGESDYHFGVEIEIYSSDNQQKALEVFEEWNNHSIYIKEDNSLSNSGFEIVSHPHSFEELKKAEWLKAIKTLKDSCTAFDKAGMHIHISRSAFDSNDHYDRFWRIWNEYPELVEWIAQRRSDQYAKVESKIGIKINSPREHDKHCAVNENNVHTIEVRVFNSHLVYSKIMKNVEFTHAVIEYTQQVTAVSVSGLWKYIKKHKELYPELLKFKKEKLKGWKTAMNLSALRDQQINSKKLTLAELSLLKEEGYYVLDDNTVVQIDGNVAYYIDDELEQTGKVSSETLEIVPKDSLFPCELKTSTLVMKDGKARIEDWKPLAKIPGLSEISTIFYNWCLQKGIWGEFVKTAKANPTKKIDNIFVEINREFEEEEVDDYGNPIVVLLCWLSTEQWNDRNWRSYSREWFNFYSELDC